jgi:hypothetical protein
VIERACVGLERGLQNRARATGAGALDQRPEPVRREQVEGLVRELLCAQDGHLVPRFAWAVVIVGASPIGGLVYLLAQRLRRRSPEPVVMRPGPSPGGSGWSGPALAEYNHAPASPLSHAVAVMAIAGAAYLAQAGQILAAAAITVVLVIIAFLKSTPPG